MSSLELRAKEVFLEALELEASERADFVARACGGDAALAERVAALLASDRAIADGDSRGARFLQPPAAEAQLSALPLPPPTEVGSYRLGELLGAGGMGEVHAAVDARDGRRVAVKLLRRDAGSEEALRRFRQEAALLARFAHEGIARVEDAGTTEAANGSRPWFAMELVVGLELDRWAREAEPPLRERVALFARVCDAVDHAHGHGVVHRDLKPSNVIVRTDGAPKVLDFGVARVIGDLTSLSMHTLAGDVLGTVAYMSPEQLAGGAHEADARSDVYSLGVMLHELLCGALPYELAGKNLFEAARVVREVEPERLSRRDARLRGDVETIVAKALEKAPARRYGSAAELAADLRRHLASEPIRARPPSVLEHLSKLARRHPAASAAALALLLGGAVALAQWVRARESAIRAESRARELALERAAGRAAAYRTQLAAATRALEDGDGDALRRALDLAPRELRGFEWRALDHLADGSRLTLTTLERAPAIPQLSADGRRVEALRARDEVGAWRLSDGALVRTWQAPGEIRAFAVAPDGGACLVATAEELALLEPAEDGGAARWRSAPAAGLGAAFDPAGRWVAAPDADGARIRFLAVEDGRVLRELLAPEPARRVDVCGGGELLLLTNAVGAARVVGVEDGRTRWLTGPGAAQLMRGGARVALESPTEGLVRICDIVTGLPIGPPLTKATGGAWAVAEDGICIASGTTAGFAIRDGRSDRVKLALLGAEPDLVALAFASDGERLITASARGTVRVWDAADDAQRLHRSAVRAGPRPAAWAIARDGASIAYATWGGAALVDARTGEPRWSRTVSRRPADSIAFSPGGDELAVGLDGGTLAFFDAQDGELLRELDFAPARGDRIAGLAWREDGELVCSGGRGSVHALRADGSSRSVWESGLEVVRVYASGPGGGFAVGGAGPGGGAALAFGSTAPDAEPRTLRMEGRLVECIAFSHDGASLAAGSDAGVVRIWRVGDGVLVRELDGADRPTGVAWSPEGTRLAVASNERDLVLWDPREAQPLCVLRPPAGRSLGIFVDWTLGRLVTGGGFVYLHAVEVELDDELRDERRAVALAWRRVEELCGIHPTCDEVDAALLREQAARADVTTPGEPGGGPLSSELLERARAQNRARGDNFNMLNSIAWGIACYPGRSAAEYERALGFARRAVELHPDDWGLLNTLAVALYRAGLDGEALEAALDCHRAREQRGLAPHPADVALEALALARLGRRDEARARLEHAVVLARDPRWDGDGDVRAFLSEAAAAVEE